MPSSAIQAVRPMLATLTEHPLDDPAFVYEPKYDGIRALIEIPPSAGGRPISIWSRLGNDKTSQFPEIARALERVRRGLRGTLILDGEIVALDDRGEPAGFQQLQGRIHLSSLAAGASQGVAFIAFDILRDGDADLTELPLTERRARLEKRLAKHTGPLVRLSEVVAADGRAMFERAKQQGWEGLIGKRADSCYRVGKRSPDWVKLKLVATQEFVVGGWTEPRGTRSAFGALLLGVYDDTGALEYVGHTGTGFDEKELRRVAALMKPLETPVSPFRVRPRPNERPHWITPKLVAQVKFTEWTSDAKLRHPTYMGLRDDVEPTRIRREPPSGRTAAVPKRPAGAGRAASHPASAHAATALKRIRDAPHSQARGSREPAAASTREKQSALPRTKTRGKANPDRTAPLGSAALGSLVDQLQDLESRRANGLLALPAGDSLEVSNLHKVFWPAARLTKGDLLRYYVQVSPFLLPVVADRALVMKRHPNGVDGKAFYQQRAPDPVPPGVRVEVVEGDEGVPSRLVGGSLKTLLYMTQLAAISQDPWFSRVQSTAIADHVAIDLDPMPEAPFSRVLEVARWVRDELATLGATGYPKTSGADGLHIFIPLPPGTPYEAGLIYCQIVATMVATKHAKEIGRAS